MNNLKNNLERTLRKPALQKPARGCEPSSLKMTSQLFPLFPIYLDKVLSVTDGDTTRTFTYHADGQLASATVGSALRADRGATPLSETETFLWDGLALIQRGDEQIMNEPHVGGGNPVASSKGTSYFNDMLGTTVGAKKDGKYSAAALTAFGESLETLQGEVTSNIKHQTSNSQNFFTGKPFVEGLGHAFLMRNYRAGLAKWQTADPMGYPDGWNQLAYCGNGVTSAVDLWGCAEWRLVELTTKELVADPSLWHALSSLGCTAAARVPGPFGEMVGFALDFKSIEDDLNELSRCIDEYGRDTVWTIDFGQIIYNMTYSRETGALYVYE